MSRLYTAVLVGVGALFTWGMVEFTAATLKPDAFGGITSWGAR